MQTPSSGQSRRALALLSIVGLWIVILLGRLFYLQVVHTDDFRAVLLRQLEQHQQVQAARDASRRRLGMRSAQALLTALNAKLQKIESIPISELRELLRDASDLVVISNAERETLEIENSKLEAALQSKRGVIDTYNRELARLQGLTLDERRMIQTLLGNVVQRESEKSFWFGAFLSFPVGVIASALAGVFLKSRWFERRFGGG